MRDAWLHLVDSVLRPARPRLARCNEAGERHVAERKLVVDGRLQALARCEARIESARAAVFAANDGVVPANMRALEREWTLLSRSDPDRGLMDLWARIAPASWVDRKRWRDSEPESKLAAAIALAADVAGVEEAESAIASLGAALAAWGNPIGPQIRWRAFEHDLEGMASLLAEPLRAAGEALSARGLEPAVRKHAQQLEQAVLEAALVRFPDRDLLARGLAQAAFVDCVLQAASDAASLAARPNPVTSLRRLWKTGYVLSAIGPSGVTVAIPPQ